MLGKLYVSRVSGLMKNLAAFAQSHARRLIVNAVVFSEQYQRTSENDQLKLAYPVSLTADLQRTDVCHRSQSESAAAAPRSR